MTKHMLVIGTQQMFIDNQSSDENLILETTKQSSCGVKLKLESSVYHRVKENDEYQMHISSDT